MKAAINFDILVRRYLRSGRKVKTQILDELCDLHGYNRKYLIQLFHFRTGKKYLRRGRKQEYKPEELAEPLKRIWLASDQMCSKKLKAALPAWLPHYAAMYEPLPADVEAKLLKMSHSTIDRMLQPYRVKYKRHGLTGTKPGYLLKNQIPIKTDNWDVTQPGFMEADTVAHCGNSMAGDFAWSLTLTDISTAWTEIRATWNKGSAGIIEGIKDIEKHLPFKLLGFDCDNGSEFLNWHLLHYFTEERPKKVQVTRSRPYKKNDNAHVEQKNWTHVRHLFGYDRFDRQKVVKLMNDLYRNEWSLYQNYFIPNMKLIEKTKVNSKYKKKYDTPKTAYQRIMLSEHISQKEKDKRKAVYGSLSPFQLKIAIENKLKVIFSMVTRNKRPRVKF